MIKCKIARMHDKGKVARMIKGKIVHMINGKNARMINGKNVHVEQM